MPQNNFYNFDNNTHNETADNSRGFLLIQLYEKYVGAAKDEKQQHDVIEQQFNACLTALPLDEIYKNWIKIKAQEALDPDHDRVTIFKKASSELESPATKNEMPHLTSENRFISIKETLAILFLAIEDDSKWKAKYPLTKRLEHLAEIITEIYNNDRCHTGIRNALVDTLNGYDNIQLLTSDDDFILKIIYEFLYTAWIGETAWQSHFKTVLWPWIKEGEMPNTLSSRLTPTLIESLKEAIRAKFLEKGLKVSEIKLQEYCLESSLQNLQCVFISDRFIVRLIEWVNTYYAPYNSYTGKQLPANLKLIVDTIIDCLDTDFSIESEEDIYRCQLIFALCGAIQKINLLNNAFNVHELFEPGLIELLLSFTHIDEKRSDVPSPTLENSRKTTFLSWEMARERVLENALENFDTRYSTIYKALFITYIENFFVEWFSDENYITKTKAYCLLRLLDPDFQRATLLSDEVIQKILAPKKEEDGPEISISVYDINRFLLHAILIPTKNWSPIFAEKLQQIIIFIENDLNQPQEQRILQLKNNSYTKGLLARIEVLIYEHTHELYVETPPYDILLKFFGSSCRMTVQMFNFFLKILSREEQLKFITSFKDVLDSLVHDIDDLGALFTDLTSATENIMLANLTCLPKLIANSSGCYYLLKKITQENKIKVIFQLGKIFITRYFRPFNELMRLLQELPEADRFSILEWFKDELKKFMLNESTLLQLLNLFPLKNRSDILTWIGMDEIQTLTENPIHFINFYDILSPENKKIFLSQFEENKLLYILQYLKALPHTLDFTLSEADIHTLEPQENISLISSDDFDVKYQSLRVDLFKTEIENFFKKWFSEGDNITQTKAMLAFTCQHPLFQKAILLADHFIAEIKTDTLDLYLINRILLQAIIVPAYRWSPSFTDILEKLLPSLNDTLTDQEDFLNKIRQFIESSENKIEKSDESSFVLFHRLIWVTGMQGNKEFDLRPNFRFLDFIDVVPQENQAIFLDGFRQDLDAILSKTTSIKCRALSLLLKKLSSPAQNLIINHYASHIKTIIYSLKELVQLMQSLTIENITLLLNNIPPKSLASFLKRSCEFKKEMANLPIEKRDLLIPKIIDTIPQIHLLMQKDFYKNKLNALLHSLILIAIQDKITAEPTWQPKPPTRIQKIPDEIRIIRIMIRENKNSSFYDVQKIYQKMRAILLLNQATLTVITFCREMTALIRNIFKDIDKLQRDIPGLFFAPQDNREDKKSGAGRPPYRTRG